MERIEADLLVPGRGEPIRNGVVMWDGPAITYAGPAAGAPPAGQEPITRAVAVLPGLWDSHGHLLGWRTPDLGRLPLEPVALRAARCAADLRAALNAGVTSVREVGGLGVHLARAVAEGTLAGPAIYAAGAVLSVTGGHGDLHSLPLPWMAEFCQNDGEFRLCDGVDECIKAAREQLRRNARLIKVCASGGVLSEADHPVHQQFTVAELRAVVEVAGLAERVVAAHCHGKPGIMAALEAGVRTIEHGTYLDTEACQAMRETGAILVPTRTAMQEMRDSDAVPPFARPKMEAIADRHTQAVTLAHQQGVTIAMGTDISISGAELANSWGRNGRELPLLAQAGLTPLEAIQAATANGPLTLGPQAPAAASSPTDTTPTSSPSTPTRWPTSPSSPTPPTSPACGKQAAGSRADLQRKTPGSPVKDTGAAALARENTPLLTVGGRSTGARPRPRQQRHQPLPLLISKGRAGSGDHPPALICTNQNRRSTGHACRTRPSRAGGGRRTRSPRCCAA